MCKDIPGQPPRLKIAECACGAVFPDCDLEEAINHITTDSSPAHYWVQIHDSVSELIPIVPLYRDRRIHDYT